MNKNLKWAIIIVVILLIAFLVFKLAFKRKNFVKGYAKKTGEWVACNVIDYDKDYYEGQNTAGATIYIKKSDVKLRAGKEASLGQCADAVKYMNVYTLKN
jgi:hypothetical protein